MESTPTPAEPPVLHATERRVLGVLIEKGLATPEYYPMTVNALVAGCNQKNNREPVTTLTEDAVVTTLDALATKGLATSVIGDSGRVPRWRQDLGRRHDLNAVQLAVLGELLLRGAQSEGDLRGRASRMRPIETLDALRELLAALRSKGLVVRLTAEGTARGVRWTHTLCPKEQLAETLADEARSEAAGAAPVAPPAMRSIPSSAAAAPTLDALAARIAALEERVRRLEDRGD